MPTDPLTMTVLDLDSALGGNADLLLAGGFGLYLKQLHLEASMARTLLPASRWPRARTTQDIDLFLLAEVCVNADEMSRYRNAFDNLGFIVVDGARYMKFTRDIDGQNLILDVMVGPLADLKDKVHQHGIRVRPKEFEGLHARATEDALGVEDEPLPILLEGTRSDGSLHRCTVLVPQTFSFALMKLGALRDRINDANKDEGRHHALDLYRIAAMLTETEDAIAGELAARYAGHPTIDQALRAIDDYLTPPDGIGRVRLREHPLCPPDADPDWLVNELRRLLSPRQHEIG